jgi:VWFA-related protein
MSGARARAVAWTVVLAALAITPAEPQVPVTAPGQPLVFGTGVELVRLDALVLDGSGRPVTGLTQGDFEIEESGRVQTITSFEPVVVRAARPAVAAEPPRLSAARLRAPSEGRSLLLYFDDVHVRQSSIERVRQALRRFLERDLREGDLVTLVAPEQEAWWTARNAWEYRQLAGVVERLKGQGGGDTYGDWEALRALEAGLPGATGGRAVMAGGGAPPGGQTGDEAIGGVGRKDASFLAEETSALVKRRTGMTLENLKRALESLVPQRGHKSLLLISEGFLLLPGMPGYQDVIDVARRANVAIHFLDPRALETGLGDASVASGEGRPQPGVLPGTRLAIATGEAEGIAVVTGGHAFGGIDADKALRQVASEAEAYYLLGYSPENAKKGERKVRVRVKRTGLKVLARSRYYVGEPEATPSPEPAPTATAVAATALGTPARRDDAAPSPRSVSAMRSVSDTTELPLRVSTLYFEPNGSGEVATLLAAEVVPPPADTAERAFKLVSEARARDGGPPVRDRFAAAPAIASPGPLVLARQWQLPPGVWQVRLLVEDSASGRIGTALHTFEVPSPTGFRLSTPIVTAELEDPNGRRKPKLALGRTFRSGSVVYCQYSIYGAPGAGPARVAGGWKLLRGETLVRETPPTPIQAAADGRLTRTLGISLQGAEPGEYALVLSAREETTGAAVTRVEPFTVAP